MNKIHQALAVLGLLAVSLSARADLPAAATTAFSTLSVNVTDIMNAIWPIVAAVVGGFTLIGLFKKGAGKIG